MDRIAIAGGVITTAGAGTWIAADATKKRVLQRADTEYLKDLVQVSRDTVLLKKLDRVKYSINPDIEAQLYYLTGLKIDHSKQELAKNLWSSPQARSMNNWLKNAAAIACVTGLALLTYSAIRGDDSQSPDSNPYRR